MKEEKRFSFKNISLAWLTVGSFLLCVLILGLVIFAAQPYLKNRSNHNNQAGDIVLSASAQTSSSDSTSLYPPIK